MQDTRSALSDVDIGEIKALSLSASDQSRLSPTEQADIYRLEASRQLDPKTRGTLGQYLTPLPVATFMASLFGDPRGDAVLLDPGAGTGTLTAAFVQRMVSGRLRPHRIQAEAYELEPLMVQYLNSTLEECAYAGKAAGIQVAGCVTEVDFIQWGVEKIYASGGLLKEERPPFTHCIMNPPYRKIRNDSNYRMWLRQIGIETGNLYSAFLALAIKLLFPDGELVAIVPRSFCNGPYFKPFRELLLDHMAIRQLHVFDSRNEAFKDDKVLQENIILHAVKGRQQGEVVVTSSSGPDFEGMTRRVVAFDKVVRPSDSDRFIHIAVSGLDQMVVDRISVFSHSLADIGVEVCTGPVVDFRLRSDIRKHAEEGDYPLIYPGHFSDNYIEWPKPAGKKPNAIQESERSARWLMANGWYVVTRRFSAKEEKRRLVAAVHAPDRVPAEKVGFENHLNVFHKNRAGLEPDAAKGLAVYLNSSLLDLYFRQFSGHTQVNATDLRTLHYPDRETLIRLGEQVSRDFPAQEEVDRLLDREIERMAKQKNKSPLIIRRRIQETRSILDAMGLPKGQRNDRSALTLLALVNLKPGDDWSEAEDPLIGVTPIMDFLRAQYGKDYAPNTRETIRRQTMHQFVDAGIAVPNPDEPTRAVNSPKWCYQVTPHTLDLIRSFGIDSWDSKLIAYSELRASLAERYAKNRDMLMIPLEINGGKKLALTPGKHSQLIEDIIREFGQRYAPGAEVLYVGDTGSKMGHFDKKAFESLGLTFDSHGKFPDVVLYLRSKNWLLLIESVTTHGPVDAKRHSELSALFTEGTAGIVYVTAFPDRQTMARYLGDISWETEVWIADAPTHLIHFNGERFLGPHSESG